MKHLKQIVSVITLALIMLASGNVDAQDKKMTEPVKSGPIISLAGNLTYPTLREFSKQYPKEYKNINVNFIQNSKGNVIKSIEELSKITYFTAPIIENSKVVGRIVFTKGDLVYLDYQNYKKNINTVLFKKNKTVVKLSLKTLLSKNKYKVNISQSKINWCAIQCTIAAVAIAASDGPSPLMDILAISFQISCLASC